MTEKKDDSVIPVQDEIYVYDEDSIKALDVARPWEEDVKFFKNVRINVLAATKMVKHAIQGVVSGRAKNGLPIEIMGLLVGKPQGDTIIVMDCVELPVEGSETRVVADDEKVLGFMTRMQDRIEALRQDRFIGWYHSHPFDVDTNSNCFFSATDVSTQFMWQNTFKKWVGIVVDPLRSLAKQKIELGCFMAYPPKHDPPQNEAPDGVIEPNKEILTSRWGALYNRYFQLKHKFFMGSLVRFNLEMMSRNHLWIRQLSSAAILEPENREELPKRITNMTKKTAGGTSDVYRSRKGPKGKGEDPLTEQTKISRDLALEQCIGHTAQIVKNFVFNPTLD